MKKLFSVIICLVLVLSFSGCGKNDSSLNSNKDEKITGNCEVTKCINQIDVTSSLSDVNKIMGFEGTLTNEKLKTYKWNVTSDSSVEVSFNSSKASIKIDFPKENVQNNKVDLSNYNEIRSLLKSGKLDYSTFVKKIGGVDGVLVEKNSYNKKYLWYNSKTKYLYGTFSNSSNRCTFISGLNN